MTIGIAVMAKAPRAGEAKTRLRPAVSGEDAARLGAAFLRDVTENLRAAAQRVPIVPYIAYAPAGTEALFDGHIADGTRMLLADGSCAVPPGVEKFGRCLLHATEALFALGHGAACVLNADSPTLPERLLLQLHDLLAAPGDRAVLGPAEDGGYYVLGMKRVHAALYANIDWSTGQVAAQTRAQAAAAGIELVELETWYDVDEPETLQRLTLDLAAAHADNVMYEAPYTRDCLRAIGLLDRTPTFAGVAA
jgi:rSAM/selenodomain-associated transferase 1